MVPQQLAGGTPGSPSRRCSGGAAVTPSRGRDGARRLCSASTQGTGFNIRLELMNEQTATKHDGVIDPDGNSPNKILQQSQKGHYLHNYYIPVIFWGQLKGSVIFLYHTSHELQTAIQTKKK